MKVRSRVAGAVAFALILLTSSALQAVPITATYTFTGQPGDQVSEPVDSQPTGATMSDITRGPGIIPNAGLNSINSRNWSTGSVIDLSDFCSFTITPDSGFELDLTRLEFTNRRSSTGPTAFEIRTSLDGFLPLATFTSPATFTGNNRISLDLTAADLTVPVEFRLYGYGSLDDAGNWRLGVNAGSSNNTLPANLQLFGDLSPVQALPEPGTLLLLGAGLAGFAAFAAWRRRRP
jgi:hypothetical protein